MPRPSWILSVTPWVAWRAAYWGNDNFGLFTLLWDRAMGTYTPANTRAVVTSDDLGIAGRPDYPTTLTGQLAEPFRPAAAMQAS